MSEEAISYLKLQKIFTFVLTGWVGLAFARWFRYLFVFVSIQEISSV